MLKPLFINLALRRTLFRTLIITLPFVLLALPLLRHAVASAAVNPGELDPAFDTDGKVVTLFPNGRDNAEDVAVQADGKVVVVGLYFPLSGTTAASGVPLGLRAEPKVYYHSPREAAKFAGQALPAATINDEAKASASAVAFAFFAVARYDTNGALDNSSDTDGKTTTDFFGVDNEAFAVVIQSDGKIVAGGYADNGSSRDFALARYKAAATRHRLLHRLLRQLPRPPRRPPRRLLRRPHPRRHQHLLLHRHRRPCHTPSSSAPRLSK